MVSPLDFEDIRQRRQQSVAAAETRVIQRRKNAPPPPPRPIPASTDPLDKLGQTNTAKLITGLAPEPLPFDPPTPEPLVAEKGPFGSGIARNVMGAAQFLNQATPLDTILAKPTPGSPEESRLSFNPIRTATGLIGLSGRIGQRAAAQAIAGTQKYLIPGRQELERLVDEEMASGQGYVDALDSAFRKAGRDGGIRIPFATTALTPEGSITVDWEDVIAAGFDPIDLALTIGSGGIGKAAKLSASAAQAARKSFLPVEAAGKAKAALPPPGPQRVVGHVPDLDRLEVQTFGGVDKGLGKVVSPVNPNIAQRIMGAGLRPLTPILSAINPTATAGTNVGKRAAILYEASAAHGANMVQATLDYIRAAGDPTDVFKLSRDQYVRVPNITLTARGQQAWQSKGLPTNGQFNFGDIAEYWVNPKNTPDVSLFDGLTPPQIEVLNRIRRGYKELSEYAESEGILKANKGVTLGQKFAEEFGTPGGVFSYVHREAVGKKIVTPDGKVEDLLFNASRSGGSGAADPFTKTRTYQLMQEGVQDGIRYANPMESYEALASAVYRQVAMKRGVDYIERTGQLVTSKQVMSKLYPGLVGQRKAADAFVNATDANIRRIKRKIAHRKAKGPLLQDADDLADLDVIKGSNKYADVVNRIQQEMIEGMDYLARSKTAANEGLRRRYRNLYQQKLGRFKSVREEAERIWSENQALFARTGTAFRRVNQNDSEIFGFTNDLAQAEAQRKLAGLVKMRVNREYAKQMESIVDAADLDARVFGAASGRMAVTHFKDGPLAGKIAPAKFAEPLAERLKDRGVTVNFMGQQRRPLAVIEQFTGSARTLSAGSLDIGWLGIQGSLLAFTHPGIYVKAAKESMQSILDPNRRARYIADNFDHVLSFVENAGDIGSSEFVQSLDRLGAFGRISKAMEGGLHSKFGQGGVDFMNQLRRVNPVTRLGAGFNAFQDVGKIELWKAMRGFTATDALTSRELTSHINNMLGTMNVRMLGVSPTQRQIEGGLLMFSPRYTRSAFALVAELARSSGKPGTLEGLATREAIRAMGLFVAGGTLVMMAIGEATNSEVQLNPLKPGWLTVKIAGQQVGISGSTRSLLDTMFRAVAIVSGQNENRDMNALVHFNPLDPKHRKENPILQYVLGRTPPGIREILTRETFDGQKIDDPIQMTGELAKELLPFALNAQFFPPPGLGRQNPLAMVPESMGLRARPDSAFERLEEARNRVAGQEFPGTPWNDLDEDRRAALRRDHPELKQFEENAHAAGSAFAPYFDRTTMDRDERNVLLTRAAMEFQSTGNGRTFREKYDDAMALHRQLRARTEREFSEQVAQLEKSRDKRLTDSASDFNRALDRYSAIKDNPENVDEFGNPDWDAINREEKAFQAEIGPELYARIRRYYLGLDEQGQPIKQEYAGQQFVSQLRQAREVLRETGYWQIADDIVGDDPEARAVWRWYESSDNPAEREAIKQRFRFINRVEKVVDRNRQRIRRANPQVDMALMLWYGTRATSREGRQFERQIQRATREEPVAAG